MTTVALVLWLATAAGGATMAGIWLVHGGPAQHEDGIARISPNRLASHAALAATGLVLWVFFAVADAYDAMTSDRSYRQAASLLHALRVLQEEAGTKYDRRAVQALCGLDREVLTAPTDLPVNLGSTVKGQGSASISILD